MSLIVTRAQHILAQAEKISEQAEAQYLGTFFIQDQGLLRISLSLHSQSHSEQLELSESEAQDLIDAINHIVTRRAARARENVGYCQEALDDAKRCAQQDALNEPYPAGLAVA